VVCALRITHRGPERKGPMMDEGTLSVFKNGRRLGVMKEGLVFLEGPALLSLAFDANKFDN
ncbi:hypothetical protein THAOC_28205, partial [Thalassiosira oceanica]